MSGVRAGSKNSDLEYSVLNPTQVRMVRVGIMIVKELGKAAMVDELLLSGSLSGRNVSVCLPNT